MTVNKAILVGNLGADPDVRATNSGTAVANLRLATSDRKKDRDGNWSDHTEWHNVVVFGRTAENVAKYCRKGKQLYIEGRIQTRKWQDRDGNDRWTTEIVGDNVRFLGGGDGSQGQHAERRQPAQQQRQGGYPPPQNYPQNYPQQGYPPGGPSQRGDDEIPF
jgi:single-strand DNA-binding protein